MTVRKVSATIQHNTVSLEGGYPLNPGPVRWGRRVAVASERVPVGLFPTMAILSILPNALHGLCCPTQTEVRMGGDGSREGGLGTRRAGSEPVCENSMMGRMWPAPVWSAV